MFDVTSLIQSGGLILIGLFIFSEVGLFLGFFLPGDTLLLTAGVFAMQGKLPLLGVIIVGIFAAIAGDSTSYIIGRKLGHKVFNKEESLIFNPRHIKQAEKFYQKYGSKAILVSHFLPIIRTFNPLVGGMAKMSYSRFLLFDAIGDTLWAIMLSLLGYYVASQIPGIDNYILIVVIAALVISVGPTIYHLIRHQKKMKAKAETKVS